MPDNAEQFDRLSAPLADRYRIDRELGRGGMATVYLADPEPDFDEWDSELKAAYGDGSPSGRPNGGMGSTR